MANIKWKERFAQVYEDSGVKDKYNKFKGYMSNVAEKLNIPSFDEVKGKVSTYADSFTDKVKEGYVNTKTGFTNLQGDFEDDGKLNYSNMDLESNKTGLNIRYDVQEKESNNVQSVEKPYGSLRNMFSKFGFASNLDKLSKDISDDKALIEADKAHRMDPRDDINNEKFAILVSYAHANPDEFKQIFEQHPDFFDTVKLHPEAVSLVEHDSALEPMLSAWKEHEAKTTYTVVGAGNSPISSGHKTWVEANEWRQANSPASNIVMEKQNTVMSEMESMKTNSNITYAVVGAGNALISQGHKTWDEANAWRQANLPSGNIVEQQNESSFVQHNQNHITGVDVEINRNDNEALTPQRQDNSLSGKWTVWEAGAPIGGTHDNKESAEQWRKDHGNVGTVRSWDEIMNKSVINKDVPVIEEEITLDVESHNKSFIDKFRNTVNDVFVPDTKVDGIVTKRYADSSLKNLIGKITNKSTRERGNEFDNIVNPYENENVVENDGI